MEQENGRTILPSEMNRGVIAQVAQKNAADIYKTMQSLDKCISFSCDPLQALGRDPLPKKAIYLQLTNNTAEDLQIPLGTPLQISDEAPFVDNLWSTIPQVERWDNDLPNLVDNIGANAPFYQLLGKRFCRQFLVVNYIEVVTTSDAQRAITPEMIVVPFNSARDSQFLQSNFMGVFTEVTITQMLDQAVILSDFSGIMYTLLAGQTVKLNIGVCGMDVPNFKLLK